MSTTGTQNSFHPQAALLYRWLLHKNDPVKGIKKSLLTPSENKTIGVHSLGGEPYEPSAVMSKVSNQGGKNGKIAIKDNFFNLETYKISALVPELRFYKTAGKSIIPFYFPIVAETPNTSTEPFSLGAAAVRDFAVSFVGTNPYTAPKYLTAELSLFVDNVSLLFAEPKPGFARLADLFTISIAQKATGNVSGGPSTVTSGDLRRPIEVTATLGYTFGDKDLFTQREIEEIIESNLTLRMNVIRHDIRVNQDGSADISISYTARIGDSVGDKIFSITDSKKDTIARADIRTLLRDGTCAADELAPAPAPVRTQADYNSKVKEVRRIMEILESNKKIHAVTFENKEVLDYIEYGVATDASTAGTAPAAPPARAAPASTSADASALGLKLDDINLSKRTVYYVTLGDLMQAFFEKSAEGVTSAIKTLSEDSTERACADGQKSKTSLVLEESLKKLKKFRVLLADINIKFNEKDPTKPTKIEKINLADIPISLALYSKFMKDQATENYNKTYTIYQFLNDCVKNLIPDALKNTFALTGVPGLVQAVPPLTSTTYTGKALSVRMSKQSIIRPTAVPAAAALKSYSFEDNNEYFIIFQKAVREFTSDSAGNKNQDSQKGVYHFELGKDRGLIKDINFSRFDAPYAQEQLMTNQVGLYDELRLPYKASITLVGNNLFMPGSQIYINPSNIGFGLPNDPNSAAHRLGIGGYYTVLQVSTSVNNGSATTTLDCSFGAHASSARDLNSTIPIAVTAGDTVEAPAPGSDATEQPIPDPSSPLAQTTSNLKGQLLSAGLQRNLAESIRAHFLSSSSLSGASTLRPPAGVSRVVRSEDGLRYFPDQNLSLDLESVKVVYDEGQTGGQVQVEPKE